MRHRYVHGLDSLWGPIHVLWKWARVIAAVRTLMNIPAVFFFLFSLPRTSCVRVCVARLWIWGTWDPSCRGPWALCRPSFSFFAFSSSLSPVWTYARDVGPVLAQISAARWLHQQCPAAECSRSRQGAFAPRTLPVTVCVCIGNHRSWWLAGKCQWPWRFCDRELCLWLNFIRIKEKLYNRKSIEFFNF